jgi:hypothetical protein
MATRAQRRPAHRPAKRPTVKGKQQPVKRVNAKPQLDETVLRKLEKVTDQLAEIRAEEQEVRDQQIDLIFEARNAGFSLRKIADSANVSNPRIHATLKEFAEE